MTGVFYGVGAAVIAIIARSAYKLTRSTVGGDRLLWILFAGERARDGLDGVGAGVALHRLAASWRSLARAPASGESRPAAAFCLPLPWLVSGLSGPATPATLSTICVFFAKAGRSCSEAGSRSFRSSTAAW